MIFYDFKFFEEDSDTREKGVEEDLILKLSEESWEFKI